MSLEQRGRRYTFDRLPYQEDVERFAPPYTPEAFTEEEKHYLRPFFSNVDKPVFIVQHLPEEVIGALSSRYSRSTLSLRRMFLDEYALPMLYPDRQRDWGEKAEDEKQEAMITRGQLLSYINALNSGGIDAVANVQRARRFFDRWLAEYGDDSIAEMGGVHLCLEGLSNVATKEIEDKRIGISPLEKSSRYVSFAEKRPDGNYQYIVPGEIRRTPLEDEYKQAMDDLFETYTKISEPYLDYIKQRYPQGDDETRASFNNSRSAKRFDDIRDLLPFATQTNLALFGNGRAFEDLVNRLMDHPLGELRFWGQAMTGELEKVVPSFVRRSKTERGAQVQIYRSNIQALREEMSAKLNTKSEFFMGQDWAQLLSSTPQADVEVLSAFLFTGRSGLSMTDVRELVGKMSLQERTEQLGRILEERKLGNPNAERPEVRFRKVPRAFENAHYMFELWARGGDYRDLHRHRQNTQERQRFTTLWGFDLENEVLESPFFEQIGDALSKAAVVSRELELGAPDVAQYAVPFGYLQHWYMNLSAREIYWMVELRTGPQGRPHYREVCQNIAQQATERDPAIFQGVMTDWNDYSLARRESEKRIERKSNELGVSRD
ncbi:FAD-dependent thymidylate synthase [Candidatus Microgenomates bacterium]|nr:FAD-dependent thymidylate synthase [Candidatus Microgenomates bacterium]